MNKSVTVGLSVVMLTTCLAAYARPPHTHRLEATPATVVYGYYWSEAQPVLRIASGDIIDVDTLLTNTPEGLAKAGVPDSEIQPSLKAIVSEVTGERRGPGGHILTGPVYVEGAEPGDVLEVKILSIQPALDYGYNGCKGFLPENCEAGAPAKIIRLDRRHMTAEFAPGIVIPLRPFFGSMGVAPAPELGRVSSNPPGRHAGNLDNRELIAGSTLFIPVFARGALFEIGDGHMRAGRRRGGPDRHRDLAPRATAAHRAQGHEARLAARRDSDRLHQHGDRPGSDRRDDDTAVQEMVDFLVNTRHLTTHQAYQLVSVAGNVAVTQLVDKPNVGVHVRLPRNIFVGTKD